MQLYLEYLRRHGLAEPDPEINITVRSTPSHYQLWSFFLHFHRPMIQGVSDEFENICSIWTRGWRIPPMEKRVTGTPTMAEQKEIVFSVLPHLSLIWRKWTELIEMHECERLFQIRDIENMNLMDCSVFFGPVLDRSPFIQPDLLVAAFDNIF